MVYGFDTSSCQRENKLDDFASRLMEKESSDAEDIADHSGGGRNCVFDRI